MQPFDRFPLGRARNGRTFVRTILIGRLGMKGKACNGRY